MHLDYGSKSAPPTGVLTPTSVVVGQLLIETCVTYSTCMHCVASLESLAQRVIQTSAISTRGVGSCSMHIESRPALNISGGMAICCHLHGDNVCCAAPKQSIMMALAAYAATPFLIEGM